MLVWSAFDGWGAGHQVLVSHSGQFLASQVWKVPLSADLVALSTNAAYMRVEPALLLVSAERVGQRLRHELSLLPPARSRIHLTVIPAQSPADSLTLLAERMPAGWKYRLGVPVVVNRQRLLEGLVHVILLEIANQAAGELSTDLPAWLVSGLAARLQSLAGEELLFAAPSGAGPVVFRRTVIERRRYDPLAQARPVLEQHGPLTWQELSWPGVAGHPETESDRFRASAELLVHELLRLPQGSAKLTKFLIHRARFLNWQTAFLTAFEAEFPRMLDVEKWWALQVACFRFEPIHGAGRASLGWTDLQASVQVPAEIRATPDELPRAKTNVSLQTVIRQWDWARQQTALMACALRLEQLIGRLPPEAQVMAMAYVRALRRYLTQRPNADLPVPATGMVRPGLPRLVYETLQQLDALDAELAQRVANASQRHPERWEELSVTRILPLPQAAVESDAEKEGSRVSSPR
ncbi:MAG: hypothetical protein RMN51_07895 [Verrucomicrobiota bacterium]|nr:hypothetical protein [Limisphaera sp.]MDW8382009.1 hypothetical protein [Verrucomicrobiota bacterium]